MLLRLGIRILRDMAFIPQSLFELLGGWYNMQLILLLCTLVFVAVDLNRYRLKLTVNNDGEVSMVHGNGIRRNYNLADTDIIFQREAYSWRIRLLGFKWMMQITDRYGDVLVIYAYAFSKSNFFEMIDNLITIQNKVLTRRGSHLLDCKWREKSCNFHCRQ
jgi:hypothetical protein